MNSKRNFESTELKFHHDNFSFDQTIVTVDGVFETVETFVESTGN